MMMIDHAVSAAICDVVDDIEDIDGGHGYGGHDDLMLTLVNPAISCSRKRH